MEKFVRFDSHHIRYGRILEVLDYSAGLVSYKYLYSSIDTDKRATIVTACCDHMRFYNSISC